MLTSDLKGLATSLGAATQEQRLEVMALACTTPIDGSTRWSIRQLADVTGYSISAVHGILNSDDLKPHKVSHWCGKSPDPEFASKQAAIIGLYMDADNLSAHKHKDVLDWVSKRRRLHLHFTPTYASWLNQIEIWFNIFARAILKGGVWRSKQALVSQIMTYIRRYKDVLAPTLCPGDIVIMDNLSTHESGDAYAEIRKREADVQFLPAYNPDLNPIEKMWSKVKQVLRGIKARTEDELFAATGTALNSVAASDAQGWFVSCNYAAFKS